AGATRKATPANRLLELDAGFVDHVEPGVHLAVDHLGELLRRTADECVEMREFGDDLRIIIDFVYGRVQLADDGLACSGPDSYPAPDWEIVALDATGLHAGHALERACRGRRKRDHLVLLDERRNRDEPGKMRVD